MLVCSFTKGVNYGPGWNIGPLSRVVIGNASFHKIVEAAGENAVDSLSNINSYEKRFGGQPLGKRRLLIYREHGYGDALMVTALVRWIRSQNPEAIIDVYSLPSVGEVWIGNTDCDLHPIPPSFDSIRRYDYHLFFENMIECNTEPEQRNCYDDFLAFAGYDPRQVPIEFKRPHMVWTEDDQRAKEIWLAEAPPRYVLWHWCPTGLNRMLPPEIANEAIRQLSQEIPVIVVGRLEREYPMPAEQPNVICKVNVNTPWRYLWPQVSCADLTIGPDSSLLHLAAVTGAPMLSLWGAFGFDSRAKYYRNSHHIDGHAVCPFSPCYSQRGTTPQRWCSQSTNYDPQSPWCSAMRSITPEQIVGEAKKVLAL